MSYPACMSPTCNGSAALQCFECDIMIKIRNGILFDFYPGLPCVLSRNNLLSHRGKSPVIFRVEAAHLCYIVTTPHFRKLSGDFCKATKLFQNSSVLLGRKTEKNSAKC